MTAKPLDGALSDERINACQKILSRDDAYANSILTAVFDQARAFNALNARLSAAGEMPPYPSLIQVSEDGGDGDPEIPCVAQADYDILATRFAALRARLSAAEGKMPEEPVWIRELRARQNPEFGSILFEHIDALRDAHTALRARCGEMETDARRWEVVMPMLTGDDTPEADAITLAIGAGLMNGETIEKIVDGLIDAIDSARSGGSDGK